MIRPHSNSPFFTTLTHPAQSDTKWDTGNFCNAELVFIGFRRLGHHVEKEHWLNRMAAYMTSQSDDVSPAGEMVHVEIALQTSPGVYYRYSIVKLFRTETVDRQTGKVTRTDIEGDVHEVLLDTDSMQKYCWLSVVVSRQEQWKVYEFLQAQKAARFNKIGYTLNFFMPKWASIGVRRIHLRNYKRKYSWHCAALVAGCFQLLPGRPGDIFRAKMASVVSPNEIYRVLTQLIHEKTPGICGGMNPVLGALTV